jgi:uncharacterized membrane protein SirB2
MMVLPAFLMLHLIALTLLVGSTLIDFLNHRLFWKLFEQQQERASGILLNSAHYSRLPGIGAALLIVTGICMVALRHGLPAGQLWFRIKMIMVLLLIVNTIFNGRRLGIKLRKIINGNSTGLEGQVMHLKGKLQTFYLIQLGILLIIIFLSAYKFN